MPEWNKSEPPEIFLATPLCLFRNNARTTPATDPERKRLEEKKARYGYLMDVVE